jgi:TolB-like protein/DNA-binding winged helix-turn-helix (wHTH) protein/Flp pilus assembly protein TadD
MFDAFRLDHRGRLCRLNGSGKAEPVALGSRASAVLQALVKSDGELVTKQALMQAAWPDTIVEEANLTVQISTLRKVLDEGRTTESCIQTVIGRGYRFRPTVEREARSAPTRAVETRGQPPVVVMASSEPGPGPRPRRRPLFWAVAVLVVCLAAAALLNRQMSANRSAASEPSPRLSLVVLPFQNLGGDTGDDHLADGITDDLTTDLSLISGALIVARQSAYTYKNRPTDVRQIGRELRVRYALEGSIRRIGDILRVNVQLISAETGTHLWSDRFDQGISQLAAGQEEITTRLSDTVGFNLVEIEQARSLRERPTNPDAFDLLLRAHSMSTHLPPTPQRNEEALSLYERALALDPLSAHAMAMVAYFLVDAPGGWGTFDNVQRAGRLLKQARALDPQSPLVLNNAVYWLRSMGRCAEVAEAAEHAIRTNPKRLRAYTGIYNELAVCKTRLGHAEEELALQAEADQLNPRSSFKFSRYRHMGFAALTLGQDTEAIAFFQRSLTLNPENPANRWTYRMLAAAYARSGRMDEARRSVSEGHRVWPYFTVRGVYPEELSSPLYVQQIRSYQDALRLAGVRDHADEDADFGVPADGSLRSEAAGRTPTQVPGAKTIRTLELVTLIADSHPLILDTVSSSWGISVPGAIGLKFSGLGGSFGDEAQDRLRRKMAELTGGDPQTPIVTVGWNAERFDGHNLALRLAALGYSRVFWYRGGREAWEVADLPETELSLQEW